MWQVTHTPELCELQGCRNPGAADPQKGAGGLQPAHLLTVPHCQPAPPKLLLEYQWPAIHRNKELGGPPYLCASFLLSEVSSSS